MSPSFKAFLALLVFVIVGSVFTVVILRSDIIFQISASFNVALMPKGAPSPKKEYTARTIPPSGDSKVTSLDKQHIIVPYL